LDRTGFALSLERFTRLVILERENDKIIWKICALNKIERRSTKISLISSVIQRKSEKKNDQQKKLGEYEEVRAKVGKRKRLRQRPKNRHKQKQKKNKSFFQKPKRNNKKSERTLEVNRNIYCLVIYIMNL